jgi:hypothetical protein
MSSRRQNARDPRSGGPGGLSLTKEENHRCTDPAWACRPYPGTSHLPNLEPSKRPLESPDASGVRGEPGDGLKSLSPLTHVIVVRPGATATLDLGIPMA